MSLGLLSGDAQVEDHVEFSGLTALIAVIVLLYPKALLFAEVIPCISFRKVVCRPDQNSFAVGERNAHMQIVLFRFFLLTDKPTQILC